MKNIILKSRALVLLVFALVFFSCQDDELIKKPNQSLKNQNLVARTASDPPYKEGASIILGENKRNPYTVQNMTTAWQYLLKTGLRPNAPASIRTTHLYIKFKPYKFHLAVFKDFRKDFLF